jgi:hypothetical protein
MKAYQQSSTSVAKSQEDIRRILSKYGADGVQFSEDWTKIQEQYERGIWRAVFWAIKSRMESVEFGIETFQEAFLSHFEIPGTNNQIGDILIPRLETGHLRLTEN